MKLLFIILTLSFTASANVLELGTIDSRQGLLDQRFTLTTTTEESKSSLESFYNSKQFDFLASIDLKPLQTHRPEDLNSQWSQLLEVSHD